MFLQSAAIARRCICRLPYALNSCKHSIAADNKENGRSSSNDKMDEKVEQYKQANLSERFRADKKHTKSALPGGYSIANAKNNYKVASKKKKKKEFNKGQLSDSVYKVLLHTEEISSKNKRGVRVQTEDNRNSINSEADESLHDGMTPDDGNKGPKARLPTISQKKRKPIAYNNYYESKVKHAMAHYCLLRCNKAVDTQTMLKQFTLKYGKMSTCHQLPCTNYQVFLINMVKPFNTGLPLLGQIINVKSKEGWNQTESVARLDSVHIQPAKLPFNLQQLASYRNLSSQVEGLADGVKLCENQMLFNFFVTGLFRKIISEVYTNTAIMAYGSAANGCSLNGSADLDLSVTIVNGKSDGQNLFKLRRIFGEQSLHKYFRVKILLQHATVPVLVMNDTTLGLPIDICMNNLSGLMMAETMYLMNVVDERFNRLVLVVKYWAKQNKLCVKGAMSSHILTMLVLAFLQHKEILPPINALHQSNVPAAKTDCSDNVNHQPTGYNFKTIGEIAELRSTGSPYNGGDGDLLLDFFQFYSDFNFRMNVIDVRSGTIIYRQHMSEALLPDPYSDSNMCRSTKSHQILALKQACKICHEILFGNSKTDDQTLWGLQLILPFPCFKSYDIDIDCLFDE